MVLMPFLGEFSGKGSIKRRYLVLALQVLLGLGLISSFNVGAEGIQTKKIQGEGEGGFPMPFPIVILPGFALEIDFDTINIIATVTVSQTEIQKSFQSNSGEMKGGPFSFTLQPGQYVLTEKYEGSVKSSNQFIGSPSVDLEPVVFTRDLNITVPTECTVSIDATIDNFEAQVRGDFAIDPPLSIPETIGTKISVRLVSTRIINGGNAGEKIQYTASFSARVRSATVVVGPIAEEQTNSAPVVDSKLIIIREDVPHSFGTEDFTMNYSDAESDNLAHVKFLSLPSKGKLTLSGADILVNDIVSAVHVSNLEYRPNPDENGSSYANFSFVVNDDGVDPNPYSSIAEVTVDVEAVNDPPTFTLSGNITGLEDFTGIRYVSVTPSAVPTDESSQPVSYTLFPSSVSFVSVSFDSSSGRVSVSAAVNGNGSQVFTVTANDGRVSNNTFSQTFTVNIVPVNDAPIAHPQSVVVSEDSRNPILLTASDADNDLLTFSLIGQPAHGSLSSVAGARLVYTPTSDYHGADSFTFKANDGKVDTAIATVNITIQPVNDKPVGSAQNIGVLEDTSKLIKLNAVDRDGGQLTYLITSFPTAGVLSGEIPDLVYTPNSDYHGVDQFSFQVNDGLLDSDVAIVKMTINPVNDHPVVTDISKVFAQKTVNNPIQLVANDVDDDTLIYRIESLPQHGLLSDLAGDLVRYTPDPNFTGDDWFAYIANDGYVDSDLVTANIKVTEILEMVVDLSQPDRLPVKLAVSGGEVSIQVPDILGQSDVSMAIKIVDVEVLPQSLQVRAKGPILEIELKDTDGGHLETAFSEPMKVQIPIGMQTIPPYPNAIALSGKAGGDMAIELVPTKVLGTWPSQFLEGQIHHLSYIFPVTNKAPTAFDQDVVIQAGMKSYEITLSGDDADDDWLTYIVASPPAQGILSGSGNKVVYVSNQDFDGSDSFLFQVSDGAVTSDTATVEIVLSKNIVPVAMDQIEPVVTFTGTHVSVTLQADDVDAKVLAFVIVDSPQYGTLSGDILEGSDSEKMSVLVDKNGVGTISGIVYQPNKNFAGDDTFTFKVNDGQVDSNIATVRLVRPYTTFHMTMLQGVNLIHLPLEIFKVNGQLVSINTIGDFYDLLGEEYVNFIITYNPESGSSGMWRSYLGPRDRGYSVDREISQDMGLVVVMKQAASLEIEGAMWQSEGRSYMELSRGINLVGMPIRDDRVRNVSDLLHLEGIRGNVTSVIVMSDKGNFEVVSQLGDTGDFQLSGDRSIIMLAQQNAVIEFFGTAWANTKTDILSGTF